MKSSRDPDSYTPSETIILQNAQLLPSMGLNMPPFALPQGKENEDTVLKLILEGILKMSVNQRILPTDCSYSGNDEEYGHFLMYLHHLSKKSATSQRDYAKICQVFKNAANYLGDKEGLFTRRAGQLFQARGDYIEAIPLWERFLLKQKQLKPQDPTALAQALCTVGCIRAFHGLNQKNGNRDELIEESTAILLQALELQETNLNRGHIDLAKTRLALAQISIELPNYKDADELADYALSEQLSDVPEDHYEIAETLLACASMHPGAFEERKIRRGFVERAIQMEPLRCHTSRCLQHDGRLFNLF